MGEGECSHAVGVAITIDPYTCRVLEQNAISCGIVLSEGVSSAKGRVGRGCLGKTNAHLSEAGRHEDYFDLMGCILRRAAPTQKISKAYGLGLHRIGATVGDVPDARSRIEVRNSPLSILE